MARDDDHSNKDGRFAHDYGADLPGEDQRREPTFGRFDVDDTYEEPDRDATYASGYHPDDVDPEDDFNDDFRDDDDDLLPEDDQSGEDGEEDEDEDEDDTWLADEREERGQWPVSLIAVAVVAAILLAAGVYGVIQQRAATDEELRELRAKLATLTIPAQDTVPLEAQGELRQAYDKLTAEVETLRLENKTLTDTVAGLEAQLESQRQAKAAAAAITRPAPTQPAVTTSAAKPTQPKPTPVKPAAAPVAKPVAATLAATATSGPWFVNFGSYATRNMADSWAARLKPSAGKVVIMPITSGGRTLYRLRVVGLPDSASAKQVARKLETELRVAELWVGKE